MIKIKCSLSPAGFILRVLIPGCWVALDAKLQMTKPRLHPSHAPPNNILHAWNKRHIWLFQMCGINGASFLGFHLLLLWYWVSYQSEFLDSKLLDKTLDVSDKSFHVVSINPLWLPRLVVSSEGQNFKLNILRTFLQLEGDTSYRLQPPDVSSGNVESGSSKQTLWKSESWIHCC